MRKNIKEELEEKYLRTVLINDNNLLIYTNNEYIENRVDVKVRYVEGNKIIEQLITSITKEEFTYLKDQLIEINDERTAIAIYKKTQKGLLLDRLYMLDIHSFSVPDFIDLEYKEYFSKNNLNEELIKKRGNKNGKY